MAINSKVKKLISVVCVVTLVVLIGIQATISESKAAARKANQVAEEVTETATEVVVKKDVNTEVVAQPPTEVPTETEEPVIAPEPVVVPEPEPEPKPVVVPEPEPAPPVDNSIVICIDSGHGGDNKGASYEYDGVLIQEKNLNYRIASTLKSCLEQYNNVRVIMTHDLGSNPGLDARINYAVANNAKYFISVHCNARSKETIDPHGSMVLMSCSRYQPANTTVPSLYDTEMSLAQNIVANLGGLGLPLANDWNTENTGGILQRVNTIGATYPDGSQSDYYGLINNGTEAGIPTIIVEHAFLSNEGDYRTYLCSNDRLDALARADANGIASALGL